MVGVQQKYPLRCEGLKKIFCYLKNLCTFAMSKYHKRSNPLNLL